MLTWNWTEFWNLFCKAHPEAKQNLGMALTAEGFDPWMKACTDSERVTALMGAPVEVALYYFPHFSDVKVARRVALKYPEHLRPLFESIWQNPNPENIRACLVLAKRLGK